MLRMPDNCSAKIMSHYKARGSHGVLVVVDDDDDDDDDDDNVFLSFQECMKVRS
jgi:hypothetical protein